MMSRAITVPNVILIQNVTRLEGKLILETPCVDFDHFVALPDVVSYEGTVCGKAAWSGENGYARYKAGARIAYAQG